MQTGGDTFIINPLSHFFDSEKLAKSLYRPTLTHHNFFSITYNEWCNKIIVLCRSDCNPNFFKGCDSSIKEFILLPKCPKNPFTAKEEKSDKKAYNSHLVKTSNLDISKTTTATFKYLIPFFSVSSHLQYHCISLIKLSIFAFS